MSDISESWLEITDSTASANLIEDNGTCTSTTVTTATATTTTTNTPTKNGYQGKNISPMNPPGSNNSNFNMTKKAGNNEAPILFKPPRQMPANTRPNKAFINNSNNSRNAAAAAFSSNQKAGDTFINDSRCYTCNVRGHLARECPVINYKRDRNLNKYLQKQRRGELFPYIVDPDFGTRKNEDIYINPGNYMFEDYQRIHYKNCVLWKRMKCENV